MAQENIVINMDFISIGNLSIDSIKTLSDYIESVPGGAAGASACAASLNGCKVGIVSKVGTDFNPDGIKGIGPKTALKLIKKHENIENVLDTLEDTHFPVDPKKIKEIMIKSSGLLFLMS